MERWSKTRRAMVVNQAVDSFLIELDEVCKRHGMDLEHEDSHGAFLVVRSTDGASFTGASDATGD
jgi:hypothetical protein